MQTSVLTGIIQRLEAMIHSEGEEPEVRRFEVEGVERCQVIYYPQEDAFEIKESGSVQDTPFRFDNIDLVAIEIYELLQ